MPRKNSPRPAPLEDATFRHAGPVVRVTLNGQHSVLPRGPCTLVLPGAEIALRYEWQFYTCTNYIVEQDPGELRWRFLPRPTDTATLIDADRNPVGQFRIVVDTRTHQIVVALTE